MKHAESRKQRTTLAELDRKVGARRKTRRTAPAVAYGRAAGSSPADVLAEIDRLRGNGGGPRPRGLLALLHATVPGERSVVTVARAYDLGAPIRTEGGRGRSFAAAAWVTPADDDGPETITAFAVEAFEDDGTAILARDVTIAPAPPLPDPAVTAAPVAVAIDVPAATPVPASLAYDDAREADVSMASADRAEDADQFEREIQAILGGRVAPPAPAAAAMSAPQAAPPDAAAARPHDVFEQMGRNMAYATAFHLPTMELGRRFDDIERQIAREEALDAQRPVPDSSLDLSDDDIAASLTATPAPTPAVAAPADAPILPPQAAAPSAAPPIPTAPAAPTTAPTSPPPPAAPVAGSGDAAAPSTRAEPTPAVAAEPTTNATVPGRPTP